MRASVISSRSTSVASSHPGRAAELGPQRCQLMERSNPRGITGGLAEALAGGDVFIGLSRPGALPPALAATMAPRRS
jgi:malate dehydrogenase (oxaloacetate-decarboxylating)